MTLTGGHRAGDLVVVVRLPGAVLVEAVGLLEEEDDVGRLRQVRLHPVRPELGQVLHPLVPHPLLVVRLLLLLHDAPDLLLYGLVRHLCKMVSVEIGQRLGESILQMFCYFYSG